MANYYLLGPKNYLQHYLADISLPLRVGLIPCN
jgi:hypothetical protein